MEAMTEMSEESIPFTERDAANLVEKILRGIAYLHSSNIMHRDIKMENIMVEKYKLDNGKIAYTPYLTDFGLAAGIKAKKETLGVGTPLYMAPEILNKQPYDQGVDIWALGVTIFIMLTSSPPYSGDSVSELKNNIKNSDLNLNGLSVFYKEGRLVKDFLRKCLQKNPKIRPSAQELLQHDWITKMHKEEIVSEEEKFNIVHNIGYFKKANDFQNNIIYYLSGLKLSKEEKRRARRRFSKIDEDGDGYISKAEAKKRLEDFKQKSKSSSDLDLNIDELFAKVDIKKDGRISYDEFLGATISQVDILNEKNLRVAFDLLDKDSDGQVSREEIAATFNLNSLEHATLVRGTATPEDWSETFKDMDTNNDGVVSFEEFRFYMEELVKKVDLDGDDEMESQTLTDRLDE